MPHQKVSNEQIYELLQAQDKRQDQQEKRSDQINELLKDQKTDFNQFKNEMNARMDRFEHNQERHEDKTDESLERTKTLESSRVQWKSWLLLLAMGATIIINFVLTRLMLLSGKFAYQLPLDPLFLS